MASFARDLSYDMKIIAIAQITSYDAIQNSIYQILARPCVNFAWPIVINSDAATACNLTSADETLRRTVNYHSEER